MDRRRLAPIAGGIVAAGAAAAVAVVDPAGADSPFPACLFHSATGLWCPGCGLTRGCHRLLRGDLPGALSMNLLTPFVVAAVVLGWWHWFQRSRMRPGLRTPEWLPGTASWAVPAALVVFGVARNLPGLAFLAPSA